MIKRKTIAAVAVLSLASPAAMLATAGTAEAAGKSYSSCANLAKDFKYGVAKSRAAADKQVRDGYSRPAFGPKARAVYKRNQSRLDRDGDGTACER